MEICQHLNFSLIQSIKMHLYSRIFTNREAKIKTVTGIWMIQVDSNMIKLKKPWVCIIDTWDSIKRNGTYLLDSCSTTISAVMTSTITHRVIWRNIILSVWEVYQIWKVWVIEGGVTDNPYIVWWYQVKQAVRKTWHLTKRTVISTTAAVITFKTIAVTTKCSAVGKGFKLGLA